MSDDELYKETDLLRFVARVGTPEMLSIVAGRKLKEVRPALAGAGPGPVPTTLVSSLERVTTLCAAASRGDVAMCAKAVELGFESRRDLLGNTPLHLAAAAGHVEVCKFLTLADVAARAGVDIEAVNAGNSTPLWLAAQMGMLGSCKVLISRGANVSFRNELGDTPLHAAAAGGHAKTCGLLLRNGAARVLVNASNFGMGSEGGGEKTPMSCAIRSGSIGTCRVLLKHGARIDPSLLEQAVERGDVRIARFLIRRGAHPNLRSVGAMRSVLHLAAQSGTYEMCEMLLDSHPEIDANAPDAFLARPIHYAANRGSSAIAELLLARGARNLRDERGFTPLMIAAAKGDVGMCDMLTDESRWPPSSSGEPGPGTLIDAQISPPGVTALSFAAKRGHRSVCELLVRRGAMVSLLSGDAKDAYVALGL